MRNRKFIGYTLDSNTIESLKEYCALNDKKASTVVDRAIMEYLKSQGFKKSSDSDLYEDN